MATKIHFNSEVKDDGYIHAGYGSSVHKNPATAYGNLEATSNWADVNCKLCLRHEPISKTVK